MRLWVVCLVVVVGCQSADPEPSLQCRRGGDNCTCEFSTADEGYEACPAADVAASYCCAAWSWPTSGDCYCRPLFCWSDADGGYCQTTPPDGSVFLADTCPAAGPACLLGQNGCACGAICAGQPTIPTCGPLAFGLSLDVCSSSDRNHVAGCN